jgi:hypothetical protein
MSHLLKMSVKLVPYQGTTLVVPQTPLKIMGFTGCGKTHSKPQKASGHDFSRAVNATK